MFFWKYIFEKLSFRRKRNFEKMCICENVRICLKRGLGICPNKRRLGTQLRCLLSSKTPLFGERVLACLGRLSKTQKCLPALLTYLNLLFIKEQDFLGFEAGSLKIGASVPYAYFLGTRNLRNPLFAHISELRSFNLKFIIVHNVKMPSGIIILQSLL